MDQDARTARLVIVGGGPRSSGVLERIGASADLLDGAPLRIDLVDPRTPGAGRIWRADEDRRLLMNSRAMDVTMFTDESSSIEGPVRPGPSLAEWAAGIADGTLAAPTAGTERLDEIRALAPESFPSRRVQALYLEWAFGRALRELPPSIEVHVHRRSAAGLRPSDAGDGAPRWEVALDDGTALDADLVLSAIGHTDAVPDPEQAALLAFAEEHGAAYSPPSQAADARLDSIGEGQDVIVRGMGLGAIDLISLLTEGRGGRFVPAPSADDPERVRYEASGDEPVLWLGSRRGAPFHSKVRGEEIPAGPTSLAHLTAAALDAAEDEDGLIDFERSVVPLIVAELRDAAPGIKFGDGAADDAPARWDLLASLDDPLASLDGDAADAEEALARTRDALIGHIETDLRERTGADPTEARALFQAMLRITGALASLLPAERLTPASRASYPRLWHSLFSFVCSGPPPHRLRQLLALERAGLVRFLGPRLRVAADPETGEFVARAAGGVRLRTRALIDARLPAPPIGRSANAFLRTLGTDIGAPDPDAPSQLRTDAASRLLDAAGEPVEGVWAVGPSTAEFPAGAFARPRTDAAVFRRNDALACRLLRAAAAIETPAVPGMTAPDAPANVPAADLEIIGAGRIGTAIGRQAVRAGLHVHVVSSQDARELRARIPGAAAGAARPSDAAPTVLALPFHAVFDLDPELLRDRIVIDATNPWGARDREAMAAARDRLGDTAAATRSSALIAAHLHASTVVKTMNHIGYHDIEDHARPDADEDRRALAVASDDPEAVAAVASLLGRLGFDAVPVAGLDRSHLLDADREVFASALSHSDLAREVA